MKRKKGCPSLCSWNTAHKRKDWCTEHCPTYCAKKEYFEKIDKLFPGSTLSSIVVSKLEVDSLR